MYLYFSAVCILECCNLLTTNDLNICQMIKKKKEQLSLGKLYSPFQPLKQRYCLNGDCQFTEVPLNAWTVLLIFSQTKT